MKFLNTEELILLNQYVQDVVERMQVLKWFSSLTEAEKTDVLEQVWVLSVQAKALEEDVSLAVERAKMKQTHTPVVMLRKGNLPFRNRGYRLKILKGVELDQAFSIILECFAIAEKRRMEKCLPLGCNHWWHQNLADPNVIKGILKNEN